MQILYEDNHLLVVVKPVNIPVQADESMDADLLSILKQDLKLRYNKPGNVYLGLVHRLDRPVGGVMVFAKTSKAASRLSELVRTRNFDKTYWAVVHHRPSAKSGSLRHFLLKDTSSHNVTSVPENTLGSKEALLTYTILAKADGLSLLQIQLQTGRSHQIRVQFAEIGCPLYGDQRYGRKWAEHGQQIALWSVQLSFDHPITKERMTFRSDPPYTYPWNLWAGNTQERS